ncbi:hypothetical protein [Dactylosporangium darangshiense]|uniref:Uncharacterized protein n=1 Tax=Dactylosporangium darangshiense TaxID=579108 RepID=A0ABP8DU30_9ACTN
MAYTVRLDLEDLRVLSGTDAPLWAKCWIDFDGIEFPGIGWSDFIGSVAGSTLTAVQDLTGGTGEACTYFFDGPYYIAYRMIPNSDWTLQVEANCDRTGEPVTLWTGHIQLRDLIESWLAAIDAILAHCRQHNLTGKGIAILQETRSGLEAATAGT